MRILLVSIGLVLLAATPAQAADPTCVDGADVTADEILGVGADFLTPLPPISDHYTREVLLRAQAAIDYTEIDTTYFLDLIFYPLAYFSWLQRGFTAISSIVDTETHVTERAKDLQSTTTCLRIDLTLIEAMIHRVNCRIQLAVDERKFVKIFALQLLMQYLGSSYDHLSAGATDHTYEDKGWWKRQAFDGPRDRLVWCCGQTDTLCAERQIRECEGQAFFSHQSCIEQSFCIAPPPDPDNLIPVDEKMCPYSTDYHAPTTIAEKEDATTLPDGSIGFGCGAEFLRPLRDLNLDHWAIDEVIRAEYETLTGALVEKDLFIEVAESMRDDVMTLESWLGIPHDDRYLLYGFTKQEHREHRTMTGCLLSGTILKYSSDEWPEGAARAEVRGPFSIESDEPRLAFDFLGLHEIWGARRPLPDRLKKPQEFREQDDRDEAAEELEKTPAFIERGNDRERESLRDKAIDQERRDAYIYAKAYDAERRIRSTFIPLAYTVTNTAKFATNLNNGIRGFTRNYAWFLLRSCHDRPCNERLERVLKIVLQASCFPYTNGNYVNRPMLHEQCQTAAGL